MESIASHYRPFVPFTQFWAQKIRILEKKEKNTPGYIIILHLHPKNYNHLMYSSLQMIPTALQVILDQFLPFYYIFGPKLKFSKTKKCLNILKILKITKILIITIISPVVPQIESAHFCSFTHFWPKMSKFSKNEKQKKAPRVLSFYILLSV